MSEDLTSKELVMGASLVEDVSLIRVMVMKKKFVEQIETWWDSRDIPWESTCILGTAEYHVIFQAENEPKLWKIHYSKFQEKLRSDLITKAGEGVDYKAIERQVKEIYSRIPQIFVD